jgi:hypothetical protein
MNSSNRKHKINYVIAHMFVPVNNKSLRNSKRQQPNSNNNITPRYEIISTRGINIITISKLLVGFDVDIAALIKKNIFDMYKKNIFIIILYNNNSIPIFIKKMSMINFINYLTNPYTNDAKVREPTDDINIIRDYKLLYKSKKITYIIYNKKLNLHMRFKNVFYDIHHHSENILNQTLSNLAKSELEREINGIYDLDGHKLPIPVYNKTSSECSLNTLLDSYGKELPQCIILLGCRTLKRTNVTGTSKGLVASSKTFIGREINLSSRGSNQVSSEESNCVLYRHPSAELHQEEYQDTPLNKNNTNFNNESFSIANIKKIIRNIRINNNNNNNNTPNNNTPNNNTPNNNTPNNNTPTPNNFEFETFKQNYLKKNTHANEKTIIKAYNKYMKKRLSFAMNASSPISRIKKRNSKKIELNTFINEYLKKKSHASKKTIIKAYEKFMKDIIDNRLLFAERRKIKNRLLFA